VTIKLLRPAAALHVLRRGFPCGAGNAGSTLAHRLVRCFRCGDGLTDTHSRSAPPHPRICRSTDSRGANFAVARAISTSLVHSRVAARLDAKEPAPKGGL